jgi:hypothetical protein
VPLKSFPKKGTHDDDIPLSVVTENSVRSENTGVPIIREMTVASTMSSLFVALLALVASTFLDP